MQCLWAKTSIHMRLGSPELLRSTWPRWTAIPLPRRRANLRNSRLPEPVYYSLTALTGGQVSAFSRDEELLFLARHRRDAV